MAIPLKQKSFDTPSDLARFAADMANSVTTIVTITFDAGSGKFVLFWV